MGRELRRLLEARFAGGGFALLGGDEELDMDKILGGDSDEPAPLPPAPALAEEVSPSQNRNRRSLQRRGKNRKKQNNRWNSFRRLQTRKR